ncbi:cytokine receptor common subunit gamma-like [Engraulis encrasicolus]|uniref:cytokine receptor common subunit gamma-like n=1 Tax=Engraulis encrasicolus TaxID=184585 RepID=UPI002FD5E02C
MPPLLSLPLLAWIVGLCSCAPLQLPEVRCYVANLEYVNCTWNAPKDPAINFTILANFIDEPSLCPSYLLNREGQVEGCKFEYKEPHRFNTFRTLLLGPGNASARQEHKMKDTVKLDPPTRLALHWEQVGQLRLSWEVTAKYNKPHCIKCRVQYGRNGKWQSPVDLVPGTFEYSVMYRSNNSQHWFQVQVRIDGTCGDSAWSEWSPLVEWGNRTDSTPPRKPPVGSWMAVILYACLATVVLGLLTCLLVHCERLRITFLPVVPTPGKNLTELIETYSGNVERWLSISKEMQEGFKPSFTERTCPVREEYHLLTPTSVESDSGVSLSDSPSSSSISSSSSSSTCSSSDTSPNDSY